MFYKEIHCFTLKIVVSHLHKNCARGLVYSFHAVVQDSIRSFRSNTGHNMGCGALEIWIVGRKHSEAEKVTYIIILLIALSGILL